MHAQRNVQWLPKQTHWGLISSFREECQAWLVCQPPAVHQTLACCASKQHWCPPFAVSHLSNACCYHLALSGANSILLAWVKPENVFWWVWLTKVQHKATKYCVKLTMNISGFRIISYQTLTLFNFNTNWYFLGFYFPPLYWTLFKTEHPSSVQRSSNTCNHTQIESTNKMPLDFLHCVIMQPYVVDWRKACWSWRRVGELLKTHPTLSTGSQKVLLLFIVTFWTRCDPTGVPAL